MKTNTQTLSDSREKKSDSISYPRRSTYAALQNNINPSTITKRQRPIKRIS